MDRPPTEALRAGLRRVRLATASLGIAALLGTGALTWTVASEETTATDESAADGSAADDSAASSGSTSGGTTLERDDSGDTADASSGAS